MKTKTCPDCNGDGVLDKGTDDEHQCPTCGGCGFVPADDDDEDVLNAADSPQFLRNLVVKPVRKRKISAGLRFQLAVARVGSPYPVCGLKLSRS
jgi:hypothetical protein